MGVERVDYYSDDEYHQALALEEQSYIDSMQEDEEYERYCQEEYCKENEGKINIEKALEILKFNAYTIDSMILYDKNFENSKDYESLIEKKNAILLAIKSLEENSELKTQLEEYKKFKCKVGDTVYRISKPSQLIPVFIYECKVIGLKQEYNTISVKLHATIEKENYSIYVDHWFEVNQIGSEFYLTHEDAEKDLGEELPF